MYLFEHLHIVSIYSVQPACLQGQDQNQDQDHNPSRADCFAVLSHPPDAANQISISHLFVQSVNIPQLSSLAAFTLHTKVTEQSSPTWSERNSLKWGPVVVRRRRET